MALRREARNSCAPIPHPQSRCPESEEKPRKVSGVGAGMGLPPRCKQLPAELAVVASAPESRTGPATYAPQDTSPSLSELSCQIWDLPDGRIISASVICVGVGAESEGREVRRPR